ncbi:MAG: IS30 family transposase [Sphaerochaetaceae bacterium]|jgi:transposase, IS30 family|nr:IS30 family transposase [Sphaerochaetaceae bacterium]
MDITNSSGNRRNRPYLRHEERFTIQKLLQQKTTVKQISVILGRSQRTIYREKKRGAVWHTRSDLSEVLVYNADFAQDRADENGTAKGPAEKIGGNRKQLQFMAEMLKENDWSPDAIIMYLDRHGWPSFCTRICTKTLYSYIYQGYLDDYGFAIKDLPAKGLRHIKGKQRRPRVAAHKGAVGRRITERPEAADDRSEVGHWEGDTIVSAKKSKPEALFTMNDRNSRFTLIRKLPARKKEDICRQLNIIETRIGTDLYRRVFQSSTFDNGSEFLDPGDLEASRYKGKKKRMDVFYAHPYASYERGTNENSNGLIRRFLPKGTKMEDVTVEKVAEVQHWLNNLPRRILGGRTPTEAFLEGLGITDEKDLAKIAWLIAS